MIPAFIQKIQGTTFLILGIKDTIAPINTILLLIVQNTFQQVKLTLRFICFKTHH